VFWEQGLKRLCAATLPGEVRSKTNWPVSTLLQAETAAPVFAPYGLSAADINIDGQADILAANFWLMRDSSSHLRPTPIGEPGGLIAAGRFNRGSYPQIITTGGGRLRWFECKIDPEKSFSWAGHDLLFGSFGTLQVADLNRDEHEDILAATCGELIANEKSKGPARAWILYGDGHGNFEKQIIQAATGWQTVSIGDLDGDRVMDMVIFSKQPQPHLEIWLNESIPPARTKPIPQLP
jgi:hypothetical protein